MFLKYDYNILANSFLKASIKNSKLDSHRILAVRLSNLFKNRGHYTIELAESANDYGSPIIEYGYPIIKLSKVKLGLAPFIYSIIKQETSFNEKMVSNDGGVGIMQLSPSTAEFYCKKNNLAYSYNNLLEKDYNIKVGSLFFEDLLKKFNNSYLLSVMAYNAGPSSVSKWLKDYGDPRNFKNIYNIIDWIELTIWLYMEKFDLRTVGNIHAIIEM